MATGGVTAGYNRLVIPGPAGTVGQPSEGERSNCALAGFMLSGFLLAFPGAILPAWGAYRDQQDFSVVGSYFLCLAVGLVAAYKPARILIGKKGVPFLLVTGCGLSCAALLWLAWFSPPASDWMRALGLAVMGLGAGLVNTGLFHAIDACYQADASGTIIRGGMWYGLGCLVVTVVALGSLANVTVTVASMAAAPALFAVLYSRISFGPVRRAAQPTLRQSLEDFRSPGAILFALALFFQFGNEWAVAGWLPLFLIHRVGMSPFDALIVLGLYWLFLMTGRLIGIAILPRFRHGRLLLGSVVLAIFGCLILYFTKTGFGAVSGAFFLGAGYASIYPLLTEAIGRRFHYYHPGVFNGIFSLAILGALLAPATLGYAAAVHSNIGVVITIPLIGSCIVMLLILSIWIEAKATGR